MIRILASFAVWLSVAFAASVFGAPAASAHVHDRLEATVVAPAAIAAPPSPVATSAEDCDAGCDHDGGTHPLGHAGMDSCLCMAFCTAATLPAALGFAGPGVRPPVETLPVVHLETIERVPPVPPPRPRV
jgi:hypothetical protein